MILIYRALATSATWLIAFVQVARAIREDTTPRPIPTTTVNVEAWLTPLGNVWVDGRINARGSDGVS